VDIIDTPYTSNLTSALENVNGEKNGKKREKHRKRLVMNLEGSGNRNFTCTEIG
jgi:hypothetical protein